MRLLFCIMDKYFLKNNRMISREGGMHLNTLLYALLHLLVDLVCAWSMFSFFTSGQYENILIYNFCAFALQMPFGTLLDLLGGKIRRSAFLFACSGVLLTVGGALSGPVLLGIGNALFHVGGGFDVIHEDLANKRNGRNLGLFVAPGAIGLFLGKILGKGKSGTAVLFAAATAMGLLLLILSRLPEKRVPAAQSEREKTSVSLIISCFLVVVLRSWIGLSTVYSWSSIPLWATVAVFLTAFGKYCGGLLGAHFGIGRTALATLTLAAIFYLFGDFPLLGTCAIFLFNMTMPLTLYLLVSQMPHLAGFSFGLLTFGLFLGFLPIYFGIRLPIPSSLSAALGSMISSLLLIFAGKAANIRAVHS